MHFSTYFRFADARCSCDVAQKVIHLWLIATIPWLTRERSEPSLLGAHFPEAAAGGAQLLAYLLALLAHLAPLLPYCLEGSRAMFVLCRYPESIHCFYLVAFWGNVLGKRNSSSSHHCRRRLPIHSACSFCVQGEPGPNRRAKKRMREVSFIFEKHAFSVSYHEDTSAGPIAGSSPPPPPPSAGEAEGAGRNNEAGCGHRAARGAGCCGRLPC